MALQNVHRIEADIKQKRYVEEPRVTSNDDIAFLVTVTDNGQPVDMAAVTMVVLASTRADRQTVITTGKKQADGSLLFELGSSETAIAGQVKGVAQLFDAEGDRISSVVFTYQVDRDPTGNGYIPTAKDKTFIEIVLVEGPAVIQEAKDVTVAASQAVSNADGATGRANAAAGNAETVIANFATVKQSTVKNKEFPTVDDRFEELEGDSYFPVSNAAAYPWTNSDSNIQQGVDGEIIFTATRSGGYVQTLVLRNINHIYYASAEVLSDSPSIGFGILSSAIKQHSGNGNYEKLAGVYTAPVSTSGAIRVQDLRTAGFTQIRVKKPLFIDLTETFGAGKEPTKDEIELLLAQFPSSWFYGTKQIGSIKQLMIWAMNELRKKANKQQDAWISPTLINGWTGDGVAFRKNQFGKIEFKGTLIEGSLGYNPFALPIGYRPAKTVYVPIIGNNLVGKLTIGSSGSVFTDSKNTYLDGVSINI